jgi:hypothetical protein
MSLTLANSNDFPLFAQRSVAHGAALISVTEPPSKIPKRGEDESFAIKRQNFMSAVYQVS